MSPVCVTSLVVTRVDEVTPLMARLVLTGDGVDLLESSASDDHVWIIFPDDDGTVRPPTVRNGRLEWPRPFPARREYTIRKLVDGELWIDFALHTPGLAAEWVQQVQPGESVWLAGPKFADVVPPQFTRIVMLGDHTALPAIARWLEELPDSTEALIAVQIPADSEKQDLGHGITWLVGDESDALIDHLEGLDVSNDGVTYLWAAGEAGLLKPLRQWARAEGFARGTCDIAGYWRRGVAG